MIRSMERAGPGLEKIVARSVRLAPAGEGPILAWPLACGSGVGARTQALTFTEGVLWVEVADKAWRTELQGLAAQYLAILNRYTAEKVQRIEFVLAEEAARTAISAPPKKHP